MSKSQHILAEGTKWRFARLDNWEPRIAAMENILKKLVRHQNETRKLLMAIFLTGIVPLRAFFTALVLKVWVLS